MRFPIALAVAGVLAFAVPAVAQQFVVSEDPDHPRVKYPDSLTSINDRCAVARGKLSTKIRPVYVNGTPVGFCCTACPAKFSKSPETYLGDFAKELECPVTHKPAKVDSAQRTYVNHEIFYVADAKARARFLTDPTKFTGLVTDPVSQVRFQPTKKSPRATWEGRPYFFTSDSTRSAFQTEPDRYGWRQGG